MSCSPQGEETMRKSVEVTASVWMKDDGSITVKFGEHRPGHVAPNGQTNLYGRLREVLEESGAPIPVAHAGQPRS